jgi:hypothetical protein
MQSAQQIEGYSVVGLPPMTIPGDVPIDLSQQAILKAEDEWS